MANVGNLKKAKPLLLTWYSDADIKGAEIDL